MPYDAVRTKGATPKLVLTFHGARGDPSQLHGLARIFLPEHHVVSPAGDVDEGGAARFFGRHEEGVYDMADMARRVEAIADFVREEAGCVDAEHTTGIGFSNGANILAAAAIAHPDIFDVLVLMHPLIPWAPEPTPDLAMTRVLITAGQSDPICPPDVTQALADWFTAQKCDVTLAWHPGGHEVPQTEIDAVREFLV